MPATPSLNGYGWNVAALDAFQWRVVERFIRSLTEPSITLYVSEHVK